MARRGGLARGGADGGGGAGGSGVLGCPSSVPANGSVCVRKDPICCFGNDPRGDQLQHQGDVHAAEVGGHAPRPGDLPANPLERRRRGSRRQSKTVAAHPRFARERLATPHMRINVPRILALVVIAAVDRRHDESLRRRGPDRTQGAQVVCDLHDSTACRERLGRVARTPFFHDYQFKDGGRT